ncbi:hypothetical protein MAPG_01223 [Magnaporthiopsis poae ATCC 64411]|uniref:Uncharacterized protein n=1 Tax=Magnaporthiopsis poae (strain ATCC 64411 / 73-15) TaxID=644358 RepID=A0A0C4DN49_MAGP6|nr:hypothetical protein MAPG_01223 [Magnaporthiopsis poae ATCC 64411]
MASLGFFSSKGRATRCQQLKETPTSSQPSSVRSDRRTLGGEDYFTDDESLVLVLSPEESLEVPAPQPSFTQAAEKRNNTRPNIMSSGGLFYGWEGLSSPTQHPTHDDGVFGAMPSAAVLRSRHPTEAQDSASSSPPTRCRTGYPDAWLEPQELDPMSSGTVFKSLADLKDPDYLTRRCKRQDGDEVDHLDLMSGGVMFRSVEDLHDPAALRKTALARAHTR